MKKKVFLFILILLGVLTFAISYASADRGIAIVLELPEREIITESKLPKSVEIIEEEAFEGTALIKVELSDNVAFIGERAFAGITTLREIKIPLSTKYIASNAFENSNRTTIIAPVNSYARAYARKQGIPFSPIMMFCASVQTVSISGIFAYRSTEIVDVETKSDFKPDTQWRRIEELNIVRTEKLIADHVQGRAPPKA